MANSLTFLFWIFGAIITSILSDKYGRKTIVFPCAVLVCIFGFISSFAQAYWVFAVFRILVGIFVGKYLIEERRGEDHQPESTTMF